METEKEWTTYAHAYVVTNYKIIFSRILYALKFNGTRATCSHFEFVRLFLGFLIH